MEAILIYGSVYLAFHFGPRLLQSAWRILAGKETIAESVNSIVDPAPADRFEVRLRRSDIPFEGGTLKAYAIEVRGRICERDARKAVLVTSILDASGEPSEPVIASYDFQQEERSSVYQERSPLGAVKAGNLFLHWEKVGNVFPGALIAPYSGQRKLLVIARVIEEDEIFQIAHGFHKQGTQHHAYASTELIEVLDEKGWQEAAEERQEAVSIVLQAGVALAGADGNFAAAEMRVIQEWIRFQINTAADEQQEEVKQRLNEIFKVAHARSVAGQLDLQSLVERLESFELPSVNRQLLDFLGKIASADHEISPEELAFIRSVGEKLGISEQEVAAIAEAQFLVEGVSLAHDTSPEAILGIGEEWSKEQIQAHLRKEFAKWNGRIQALSEPEERAKAQEMIERIAMLRKKYS